MLAATARVPSYRLHKPSGQARVIVDGRHIYLGPYGSVESQEKYARLIAERATRGAAPASIAVTTASIQSFTVLEVLGRYREFAADHYCRDGKPTKELVCMKHALRPLRELYGSTSVADFGPKSLKAVRQHMIANGLCRTVTNARINRIKRFFKWGVSEELVPSAVYEALRTVSGLRFGHPGVRETAPVGPAPAADVDAVVPFLSRQVAAMVRLTTACCSAERIAKPGCAGSRSNAGFRTPRSRLRRASGAAH